LPAANSVSAETSRHLLKKNGIMGREGSGRGRRPGGGKPPASQRRGRGEQVNRGSRGERNDRGERGDRGGATNGAAVPARLLLTRLARDGAIWNVYIVTSAPAGGPAHTQLEFEDPGADSVRYTRRAEGALLDALYSGAPVSRSNLQDELELALAAAGVDSADSADSGDAAAADAAAAAVDSAEHAAGRAGADPADPGDPPQNSQ
jgi:hypothetical protein